MSKFENYLDSEHYANLMELHPHIIKRIEIFWGQPEARSYLMELLMDTRDGARKGFHRPASRAISFFLNEHDTYFPQFVKDFDMPWRYFTK